jgi:transcriptional regulator with XRE-family HTH domain
MAERFKTSDDAARLGAQMRSVRKSRGLTLIYVSKCTGVDAGQLSKLERGQMTTVSKNVQNICTFLQIPATTGNLPPTRAGGLLDELVAGLPDSEPAVAKLIAAIQEIVLSVAAHSRERRAD